MASKNKQNLAEQIKRKLRLHFGCSVEDATESYLFKACALVLRDIMSDRQLTSEQKTEQLEKREVHYLSMEFLVGRSLLKNAYNLGLIDDMKKACKELGYDFIDLCEMEPDAGLGNGGLGRLAACYLDSLTTLEIPACGYSICYELGIFKQKIINGQQVELADDWMGLGEVWLIPKVEEAVEVHFGGKIRGAWEDGKYAIQYTDYQTVLAIPKDMEISGFETEHTNLLRLWDAKSPVPADMALYSSGDYLKAVEQQAMAEVIAKVLYPADDHYEGKSLRLKQQYFFASATIQSIVREHRKRYGTLANFHRKHVIQINDTHPTLAIPELMRILLDEEGYTWQEAWGIVTQTFAYTNHTVLSEALERWNQELISTLLPRIWMIIQEIASRYESELSAVSNGNLNYVARQAIIWGGEVRMANLCTHACFAVNGVSALHSQILKDDVFRETYERTPDKFKNVTNGIDHRRWLSQSNEPLDALIVKCTGSKAYLTKPQQLEGLEKFVDDASVLTELGKIKRKNKEAFAAYLKKESGIVLNTDAIFDVQAKRLHEYKRQLLNVLHIVDLYQQLQNNPNMDMVPQAFLFAAKAAPGYHVAKEIIRLINSLAKQINADPICKDKLQVVFLENYRVSMAEKMIPASEISEQISTAGKEASGTGNMKFMMNGALTIGTLDGANVEMHEVLGDENMFLFGLDAQGVKDRWAQGYNPYEVYTHNQPLKNVIDRISLGFSDGVSYTELTNRLLYGAGGSHADEYLLLADYESYKEAHARAAATYLDKKHWNQMALRNIARSGIFAADRSIADYADEIWHVKYKGKK